MNKKEFECANGRTYLLPENHCAFCEYCTDIFFDYTNGPYMFICELCEIDYEKCNSFKEVKND